MPDDLTSNTATADAPPDTSSLPVDSRSNLAAAISGGGLDSLAAPAPDTSSLPSDSRQAPPNPVQATPPATTPQAPLQGLGGRLRGVLYGLATGGIPGAVEGAIAPNVARTHFQQNEAVRAAKTSAAQSNAQFESVQAADMAIKASREAQTIDLMNDEARGRIRQLNDAHVDYLFKTYGIPPDVVLEGNGQDVHDQATAALHTLAAENGGQIPPVSALVQPHTADQPKFKISVFAPSLQDLQRNTAGYRKLVDTARAVQGLPPIDDLTWTTGAGNGYQGQRGLVTAAQTFLSPVQPFNENNLPSVLAQRKQQLTAYEQHTDRNGNPDADPATVATLQRSVDLLSGAQQDMAATKSKQAADQTAAMENARANTPSGQREARLQNLEIDKTQNELDRMKNMSGTDAFGANIGITPEGNTLTRAEYDAAQKGFSKEYVQPLTVLNKTMLEFQRINSNPNQTGAEKVTALLNAVGISGDPLKGKGFRISNDVINEHAASRNIWESGVQKLNTIAGSGGPITSKQISDYTAVAQGVVHDAYLTAAQEARRQGLPVNFLPKATQQNQRIDPLTARIYLDSAGGNKAAARKAATVSGWSF